MKNSNMTRKITKEGLQDQLNKIKVGDDGLTGGTRAIRVEKTSLNESIADTM